MFSIARHAVSLAHLGIANWMALWGAQLVSFERCWAITNELTASWRAGRARPLAFEGASEDASRGPFPDGDPAVERLFRCWSTLYRTAALYEALDSARPHLADLVESRIEEFNYGLSAAREAEAPRRDTPTAPSKDFAS